MILGVAHLANKEYKRDNLHISSWFLASLLDNGVAKAEAKLLLVKMFHEDLVEGVDDMLGFVVEGRGVPIRVEDISSTPKTTCKNNANLLQESMQERGSKG